MMNFLMIAGFGIAWVGFLIWRDRGPSRSGRRSKGDGGSFYGCGGGDSSCGGGGSSCGGGGGD
ncbi:hypothetical protein OOK31_35455 [Streptomyces sp. NBC_00249]|uniref:hypothetical protein n=1 Tax=Streptomyces sp. NBC_00249 TaxID=2975690 RepID=UPI00225485FD|nr:hypothetical protein [Streptomyces sp. NBC_00249]MCX5199125.1 hypothetical protein [Streptomyces sp. NBC_00249]